MKILAIDTSTQTASVALFEDGVVLGEMAINTPKTHSQKLMPLVESLMAFHEVSVKELDQIRVCEGPGSFTGVRIGLSSAKAMAQPYGIPIVTLSSLQLLALGASLFKGYIISMIDAKRGEVYCGQYLSEDLSMTKVSEQVMNVEVLLDQLEQGKINPQALPVLFIGEGASLYEPQILERKGQASWLVKTHVYPKAVDFVGIDLSQVNEKTYLDVTANYMRLSQAERDKK